MNYKPDESTLISYLYGELSDKENEKVQRYFQEHPEELTAFKELLQVRTIMGEMQDKEVIAPPILVEEGSNLRSLWRSAYFRIPMSIAASFLVVMIAAKLLGTQISYSNNELKVSFGNKVEPKIENTASGLSEGKVQEMINQSLAENNQVVTSNWNARQQELNHSIQKSLQQNSLKIDEMMKTASQASQDQVRTFVAGLQDQNLKLMKDYLQLSSNDQKKYIENLLVDFSKYMQEQRKQDMMVFQTRVGSIEKNSDQFKQETEQILASIISNLDGTTKKTNNY